MNLGAGAVYDPKGSPMNYKFGSKELQETGFYDFGARFYMSDIAIFGTHDPLSEKTLQPYAYAYNNPIFYNDPTGMEGEESSSGSDGGGYGESGEGDVNLAFGVKASEIQKTSGLGGMNVYSFRDNYEMNDKKNENAKSEDGLDHAEKLKDNNINFDNYDNCPPKCPKGVTVTNKVEATLIKYLNLLGAKIEIASTAGTTVGKGDIDVATTNGGVPTYSIKLRLLGMASISVGADKNGNLTSLSGQLSFGGITLKESLSKGTVSAELSLKREINFNGVKASYTPGVGPSRLPKLIPPPAIPLPMPRPIFVP